MAGPIDLEDYDFPLPPELVAQHPADRRVDARLLVWEASGQLAHRRFVELLSLLDPNDLVVLNDTRVFPARLFGTRHGGGARVEVLLVREVDGEWEAFVRPSRRLKPGAVVDLEGGVPVTIGEAVGDGMRRVRFATGFDVQDHCTGHGHIPLPPYIRRGEERADRERYQTVFARHRGSVAAPTAGLHFDENLLRAVRKRGVEIATLTLHVGPGTFRPVEANQVLAGELHPEWRQIPGATVEAIAACRARGGRVIAVGTTVCRALESMPQDTAGEREGPTRLMISPGFRFRFTDVLVTNFHLPRSSLLLLVSAFAGDRWVEAYRVAVAEGYRFYSYGDANWIEAGR